MVEPNAQLDIIPNVPNDPAGAFRWTLEHILGFDTQAKRDRVTQRGGINTVDDLLLVDQESLLDCLLDTTSVMAKTKLKTMKRWAEEQNDLGRSLDIHD